MPKRSGCLFSLFSNDNESAKELPYEQNEGVLTDAELSFYHALLLALEVMDLKALVCPKVGLKDVFRVVTQDNGEYISYLNKIDRKHVDFLLCDPRGLSLIAGVELDDSTHLSERGRARDVFVEKVYKTAGLPLLRFRVQHTYDIPDMVRYIRGALDFVDREESPLAIADTGMTIEKKPLTQISPETEDTELEAPQEKTAAAVIPDVPHCPRCGAPMVLRKAHRGKLQGGHFWGCSRFPRCRSIVEVKI